MKEHKHKWSLSYESIEEEKYRLPMEAFCIADPECDRKLVLTTVPEEVQKERLERLSSPPVKLPPVTKELTEEVRRSPRADEVEEEFLGGQ